MIELLSFFLRVIEVFSQLTIAACGVVFVSMFISRGRK